MDLQREVSRCTKQKGNALFQLVHQGGHEIREADYIFEKLESDRTSIEANLGLAPGWSADQGEYKIIVRKKLDDLYVEENRLLIHQFFADTLNRFVNAFRPRLERIGEKIKE